jgi:sugar phosphate isomerase/epimerase
MIRLGANTVLFGEHDFRTAAEHIKWAGYDAAEISALSGMANHLPLDDWQKHAPEIKAIVEDLDLPLTAMEVGASAEERLLPAFEAGAEIGIPVVNIGPQGHEQDNPDDMARLIDHLNAMAAKAEPFGVTLCMKAHVKTAMHSTPTTLQVMEGVSSPAFGIDMDPIHYGPEPHPPRGRGAQGSAQASHIPRQARAHPRLRRSGAEPRRPGDAGLRAGRGGPDGVLQGAC